MLRVSPQNENLIISQIYLHNVCRPPDSVIDLLMGLFRGAVFRHGGGARKQPIKQPTEMPTSTMVLMGRFPR